MARANPRIWERAKAKAKARMGGKHSARAMQLAAKYYRDMGGKYTGSKNAGQKSMTKWTKEDWGTKSGKNSVYGKDATGERYLPKRDREKLTKAQYASSTRKKRADLKKGKQFSQQPKKVKKKLGRKK
jgi:uncharacterized protein YaiL (DUF2058 family)